MPASTRFPIGIYVGNPNGNDIAAEAAFEVDLNSFVSVMDGARLATNAAVTANVRR